MQRLTWAAVLVLGCEAPLPTPPERPYDGGVVPAASLEVEPGSVTAAASVVRIRVRFAGQVQASDTLRLYAGELSRYHLGRIVANDLPATLRERIVPVLSWSDSDGSSSLTTFAPTTPLVPGVYSVASQDLGLIGVVNVTGDVAPFAARLWPPLDGGVGAAHVVFCGDAGLGEAALDVTLDPGAVPAELKRGIGERAKLSDRCSELEVHAPVDAPALVPPPLAAGIAFDPAPLSIAEAPAPPAAAPCVSEEVRFGPGCGRVLDDRVIVRSADAPLLWLIDGPAGPQLEIAASGARFVVLGLTAHSSHAFELWTYDLAGRRSADRAELIAGEPRAHVVVNEVLANATGPEPAQEWIELYNDGGQAVELDGCTIEDVGGITLLGPHLLEPDAFVLVVGEDYDAASDLDVMPAPGSALLRVPRVGKNGLGNSGERLVLRDASGVELSRFPAVSTSAGRSIARKHPHSLDDDPASFAEHAAPGASPGAANEF